MIQIRHIVGYPCTSAKALQPSRQSLPDVKPPQLGLESLPQTQCPTTSSMTQSLGTTDMGPFLCNNRVSKTSGNKST